MKPVDNWRSVLRHAWSLRLIVLAAVLGGLEVVLPLFSDAVPRALFALLSVLVSVGAAIARFVAQPKSLGGDQ
jgi:hypothetical protein